MPIPDVVTKLDTKRPESFLDALSPRGKYFQRFEREDYLFRGQADASWSLVPSAFRTGAWLKMRQGWRKRPDSLDHTQQILAEAETLEAFFRDADASGLALPEDSQTTRYLLHEADRFTSGQWEWPPMQLLSLLALAQHYGIATRLMDWSRNPYIAAYFAASGAMAEWPDVTLISRDEREALPAGSGAEGKHLCVWAFSQLAMDIDRKMSPQIPDQADVHRSIELVTAPAASNPNLHAQQGVFTLSRQAEVDLNGRVERVPLDEEVRNTMLPFANHTVLVQYTVSAKHAVRILQLLAKEGVTAATVFPGYYGVAKALKERAYWELLPL